nr:uncharacterized protein LOC129264668 [Lytechinus pictus]
MELPQKEFTSTDYSLEIDANGANIPIYEADSSSDFDLNLVCSNEENINGLIFYLLSNPSGQGYSIRFRAQGLDVTTPDGSSISYTYAISEVPSDATLQFSVEGNQLFIRIRLGESYTNLIETGLTIERSTVRFICVGATRVFRIRHYCGSLQWISHPSIPEIDDDTPREHQALNFETRGNGNPYFHAELAFKLSQPSRYDFLVQATEGAIIYLSSGQDASSAVYRLVIGDGGNTVSLYRGSGTEPISTSTPNIPDDLLSGNKYSRFSLTISRNTDKYLTILLEQRFFHSAIAPRLLSYTETSTKYEQSALYLGFDSVAGYTIYWRCYVFFIRSGSSLAQGYTQTIGNDRYIQVGPFADGDRRLLLATSLESDFVVEFLDSHKVLVARISFGVENNARTVFSQNGQDISADRGLEPDNDQYTYIWMSFNEIFRAGYQFESKAFITSESISELANIRYAQFKAGDSSQTNQYTCYFWRYFYEVDGELVGRFSNINYECYTMEDDAWGHSATVTSKLPLCWTSYIGFGSSRENVYTAHIIQQ